jgi:hypothetical protein
MRNADRVFIASLLSMSVCAAVLILLIPSLFSDCGPSHWLHAGLAALLVVLAGLTVRLRRRP